MYVQNYDTKNCVYIALNINASDFFALRQINF